MSDELTDLTKRSHETGLLVSVRDASEAAIAFASDVDIVDIKEPDNGSLGKASPDSIQSILAITPNDACISVALGELNELSESYLDETIGLIARHPQIRFAKLGLAKMNDQSDWPEQWANVIAQLPNSVAAVAVAYADHTTAHSPHPREVINTGFDLKCGAVLFDTFHKFQGNIFAHLNTLELSMLRNQIRDFGMQFVMAGSISSDSLAKALEIEPDWIGVRGAICRAGIREDKICSDAIVELQHRLNQMMKIRISN